MGNRITRAATHLSRDAVQKRMQEEQHPWRRQRWEIIYQALRTPRKAEDIARTVGVSPSTVHRVIAAYNQAGVGAMTHLARAGVVTTISRWSKNRSCSNRSWCVRREEKWQRQW